MRHGFEVGRVFEQRYEAVAPLNHGSFGMVFLAKDRTLEQLVAIKCLSKSTSKADCPVIEVDENSQELSSHERLGDHSNIVNLLNSFETKAHTYLVLEYCPMGDLYEAIRLGRGPLETENVREFMLQLVGAVEHMHAKGLYHRDIKPENIFLTQHGSMKLGDLGLATSDAWTHDASVGSDRYMAPEQYDPQDVGYSPAKSDCWAIGICLLNVLFSRNPFVTPTESDVLYADFVRDAKSLFDIFPAMSDDTFKVLQAAMAIDPTKRSLAQIRTALEAVVSFTTDGDVPDDFCTEMRDLAAARADREPLRTPSISSPQVDDGSFPWAKVLHTSPARNGRQLSAIPDTESYIEDLFAPSEADRNSWFSWAQNSSMTSGLDSILGTSVKSLAFNPSALRNLPTTKPVAVPNSLPSRIASLSHIFSSKNNDNVSKSWTDMYDEDEAESIAQQEATTKLESTRTSRPSSKAVGQQEHDGVRTSDIISEKQSSNASSDHLNSPADSGHDEVFAFEESAPRPVSKHTTESTLSKRTIMDKWAALGNRRRQFKQNDDVVSDDSRKRILTSNWRNGFGLKVFSGGNGSDKAGRKELNARVLDWRKNTPAPQHRPVKDIGWDIEWVGDR